MAQITKESINKKLVYSKLIEDWKGPSFYHELQCCCGKIYQRRGADLIYKKGYTNCGCSIGKQAYLKNPEDALRNSVILVYKTNALKKKLEFKLTDAQVISYFTQPCYYCGIIEYNSTHTRKRKGRKVIKDRQYTFKYNGIDRVDPKKGYILSNCVACCKVCNISKNNLSKEEFLNWLKRAYLWTFNDQSKDLEPSGSKQETP